MSVPPDRMAPRSGTVSVKDPTKIMGVKKPVFYGIVILGVVLAIYIWMRSRNQANSALTSADAGAQPDTNGVTAADIGGTPADNSFATQTDAAAIEQQIQSLQDSLFQLQQSNGGNGAGISAGSPGGNPAGTGVTTSNTPTANIPITTQPITNPIATPVTGGNTVPITGPVYTPGGGTVGTPVVLPQSNAVGDLNLVSQGLTPATIGPHLNPY